VSTAPQNSEIILHFCDQYKSRDTMGQKGQDTDSRLAEMRNVH
jgi:hypothetical protein